MKCPKCGHENPEGTLFCEECDWRMDQKVSLGGVDKSAMIVYAAYMSAAFGIAALISAVLGYAWFGVGFGAIGMALASYSQTAVRISNIQGKVRTVLIIIAAIGIVTSVIGFIYGFYAALK